MEATVFYFFASVLVLSAVGVITVRNPVFAALLLVLCFFTSAAIWLLLEAEFLALTLVLVYVGAVMVLFLFVLMMLDVHTESMHKGFTKYVPLGLFVAIVMALELSIIVGPEQFGLDIINRPELHAADYSNTKELGLELYTVYVYPFEIASVILLVAIIAAIALTLRKRKKKSHMGPDQQVNVNRNDRVRIIKMKSEKRPW